MAKVTFTLRISKNGTFRWTDSRIKAERPNQTDGVSFCQVVAATAAEVGKEQITIVKPTRTRKRKSK